MLFRSVFVLANLGGVLRVILVLLKLFESRRFGRNAIGGDLHVRDPADSVEYDFSEIVVLPVVMKVTAGESESTATVLVFRNPHHMLEVAASNGCAGIGRGIVMVVLFGNYIEWRNGGEDRRDALHALAEAHIEIPLVVDAERFDSVGDGVVGKGLEPGGPVRIDGFVELVVAAHPAKEGVTRFAVDSFDSVVEATYPYAFGLKGVDGSDVVVGYVSIAAVAIDDHGVDAFEELLVGRPARVFFIIVDGSADIESALVEHFSKEQRSGVVLMGIVAVAFLSGYEKNVCLVGEA